MCIDDFFWLEDFEGVNPVKIANKGPTLMWLYTGIVYRTSGKLLFEFIADSCCTVFAVGDSSAKGKNCAPQKFGAVHTVCESVLVCVLRTSVGWSQGRVLCVAQEDAEATEQGAPVDEEGGHVAVLWSHCQWVPMHGTWSIEPAGCAHQFMVQCVLCFLFPLYVPSYTWTHLQLHSRPDLIIIVNGLILWSYAATIQCKLVHARAHTHTHTHTHSPSYLIVTPPSPSPSPLSPLSSSSHLPPSPHPPTAVEGDETVQDFNNSNVSGDWLSRISIFFTVRKWWDVSMCTFVCTYVCHISTAYVCCSFHPVVYSVELTVKILALGPHSFFTKAWNVWVLLDTLMYVHCRRLECVCTLRVETPVAVVVVFWPALTHTRSTKRPNLAS